MKEIALDIPNIVFSGNIGPCLPAQSLYIFYNRNNNDGG
jgi:hypothetical protein